MPDNIIGAIPGEDKKQDFRNVCLRLGVMLMIIFASRGVENILYSLEIGWFSSFDPNATYLLETAMSFLFLYIIPLCCTIALLKPPGMCGKVYKKPKFFGSAMGMFPALYGVAIMTNMLTMLCSKLFEQTDLYKSFNTVNSLRPDNMFCAIVLLVQLVVIAPLFEEFWFRGIVLESLRPYGNGFAIFVSALMFGLTHANLNQFFYAFVLGIGLGYIAVSTESIVTTTIMHAMFNSISGIMLLLITFPDVGDYLMAQAAGMEGEMTPMVTVYLVFLFVIFLLMLVGVFMAIAKFRKIKRYKVPKMWDVPAGKRWGILLSRFTVIIGLIFAVDTMGMQYITRGIFKLLTMAFSLE